MRIKSQNTTQYKINYDCQPMLKLNYITVKIKFKNSKIINSIT